MAPKQAELKLEGEKLQAERDERRKILEPVVLRVVSALGGYEDVLAAGQSTNVDGEIKTERVYRLGDECIGCLKDLKKFWRLDDDDQYRTVARILHFSQILPNDLLPILMSITSDNKKDQRVALLCADLIAALTWPIDIAAELKEAHELDDEKARNQAQLIDFSNLIAAQLSYKRDILRTGAIGHIFRLILPAIQKSRTERTAKDENVISLVLHIIRNLLALRDKPANAATSSGYTEECYLQSEFISQLSRFGIFDLLIHMSYGANRFDLYGQWNMVVLDIWHLLFRGLNAQDLIDAESFVNTNEAGETARTTKTVDKHLEKLLLNEEKEKKAKARRGVTRHSRFGTTLTVQAGERKYNLHHQSAITTPVEHAIEVRKKPQKKTIRLVDGLGPPTLLRPEASKILRKVVIEFIESGFNPFFSSVLQDIRMERQNAKAVDGMRLLSLLAFFLESFLAVRERESQVGILPTSEVGHDFELIAGLLEPECILWVVSRIRSGLDDKPMPTIEIQTAVGCLIQQLLVIEGLSISGVDEYVEVANTIQNNLYYDNETLDMALNLMAKYTDQSIKYLEDIVHFAHVFLRMLERYAKSTAYMFVRKKKTRKTNNSIKSSNPEAIDVPDERAGLINVGEDEEERELDEAENRVAYAEHKFEFEKFQKRFAQNDVLDTLMTYIRGYQEFSDPELMKRAVKLMYRQAVNAKGEKIFFKASVLDTLNYMLENKNSMPKHSAYEDLIRLADFILKQYFKCVRENPFVLIETLFSKKLKEWGHIFDGSGSDSDLSPTAKALKTKKVLKLPAEIQIKPGLTWSQQLGVAVGLLVDDNKIHLVNSVLNTLRNASASRTAVVLMTDQDTENADEPDFQAILNHPESELSEALLKQFGEPSEEALQKFEDHEVDAANDADYQKALGRDPKLHTLLSQLRWEKEEEEPGHLSWTIPKKRLHSQLNLDIKLINHFLIEPLNIDGKPAAEFTKRTRKATRRTRRTRETAGSDESGLESDASGIKQKKAKTSQMEQKQEEVRNYLSAQFVADSDDEENEERDRLFFEKERQLRLRLHEAFIEGNKKRAEAIKTRSKPNRKSKSSKSSKSKQKALIGEEDLDMELDEPLVQDGDEPSSSSDSDNDSQIGQQTTTATPPRSSQSSTQSSKIIIDHKTGDKRDLDSILTKSSRGILEDAEEIEVEPTIRRNKTRKLFLDSDE